MEAPKRLFLMLIKVLDPALKQDPRLARWIDEIEDEYMAKYASLGVSVAHLALDGRGHWDFALVFPGSQESVDYLEQQISSRAPRQTEIQTLGGEDLDEFRKRLAK